MKYKFIGKPDRRFSDLVTGKIYDLIIQEKSKGLFGWLVGNTYPVIEEPIKCPYSSWDTFNNNWVAV